MCTYYYEYNGLKRSIQLTETREAIMGSALARFFILVYVMWMNQKGEKSMTIRFIQAVLAGSTESNNKMIILFEIWIPLYVLNYLHLPEMEEKMVNFIILRQTRFAMY